MAPDVSTKQGIGLTLITAYCRRSDNTEVGTQVQAFGSWLEDVRP